METKARAGRRRPPAPPPAMASSSKASDSSSQRSKVSVASRFHAPRVRRTDLPNLIGFDLFRLMLPCFGCLQRSDQGTGRDAAAASVVAIHGKLTQLVRQIQSKRLAHIKVSARTRPDHVAEISRGAAGLDCSIGGLGVFSSLQDKLEANRKTLQRHTCALFDVAAATEVASRGTEGGNALSQRAAEFQSRPAGSDLANGMGERDVVYVQEENPAAGTLVLSGSGSGGAAQRTVLRFVKLPLIERIPPYTTWIFLDKYSAVAPF